jgi:putative transposase
MQMVTEFVVTSTVASGGFSVLEAARRVLRLMRENDLLAPGRVGSPRGPRTRDGTIVPETVDMIWGADLTTTFTGEGPAAVFIAVDHCSAECVGVHAHARAMRFKAPEPIRQGVRRYFGGFARGLAVWHDHGSQYISDHFQKEIAFLGAESSPAFVGAPEGNGCAERFIRTLKENLLWARYFETIEELREALLAFRETYNTADPAARLPVAGRVPPDTTSTGRRGRIGFNPVSQKPRAVQNPAIVLPSVYRSALYGKAENLHQSCRYWCSWVCFDFSEPRTSSEFVLMREPEGSAPNARIAMVSRTSRRARRHRAFSTQFVDNSVDAVRCNRHVTR